MKNKKSFMLYALFSIILIALLLLCFTLSKTVILYFVIFALFLTLMCCLYAMYYYNQHKEEDIQLPHFIAYGFKIASILSGFLFILYFI